MKEYETVVLDAQYFDKEQIKGLKNTVCQRVLSYLNIGAIENFRPYYDIYVQYALGDYEHWSEEKWMDVSQPEWQIFLENLALSYKDKGVDGFYIDNADVYYHYHTDEIYDGITHILYNLGVENSSYILLNGGDTYLYEYLSRNEDMQIVNAVNQETVFTKINWDTNTFSKAKKDDREYFQEYIETVASQGVDVFLLEYSKSNSLNRQIDSYCNKHGFKYYISTTLELLKP